MMTNDERLELVKSRSRLIRHRNRQRTSFLLALGSGATCAALIALIMSLSQGGYGVVQGLYGSVLRFGDVGGYVLVALCSFVIAAVLTVAFFKYSERRARSYRRSIK